MAWRAGPSPTSGANLARLYHSLAIFGGTPDETDTWRSAYRQWSRVLEDEDFWAWQRTAETDSGFDPQASEEDLRLLRKSAWQLVLDPTGNIITAAFDRRDYRYLLLHADALRQSSVPDVVVLTFLGSVLDGMNQAVGREVREVLDWLNEQPADMTIFDDALARYRQTVQPVLDVASNLALGDDGLDQEVRRTAGKLRTLAVTYYNNKLHCHEKALALMNEVATLLRDSFEIEKIRSDIETIAGYVENQKEVKEEAEDQEWRDFAEATDQSGVYEVTIRSGEGVTVPPLCTCCLKETDATDRASGRTKTINGKVERTVQFPLCPECREHRRRHTMKQIGVSAVLITLGVIVSLSLLNSEPDIAFFPFSLAVGIVILAFYLLLNVCVPLKELGEHHATRGRSLKVRFANAGPWTYLMTFDFWNPHYAVMFAAANDVKLKKCRKWKRSLSRRFPLFSRATVTILATAVGVVGIFSLFAQDAIIHANQAPAPPSTVSEAPAPPPEPEPSAPHDDVRPSQEKIDELHQILRTRRAEMQEEEDRLKRLRSEIEASDASIEGLKRQIKQAESDNDAGLTVDEDAYHRMIETHNRNVAINNRRIADYRSAAYDYHDHIKEFNSLVDTYNDMLKGRKDE